MEPNPRLCVTGWGEPLGLGGRWSLTSSCPRRPGGPPYSSSQPPPLAKQEASAWAPGSPIPSANPQSVLFLLGCCLCIASRFRTHHFWRRNPQNPSAHIRGGCSQGCPPPCPCPPSHKLRHMQPSSILPSAKPWRGLWTGPLHPFILAFTHCLGEAHAALSWAQRGMACSSHHCLF